MSTLVAPAPTRAYSLGPVMPHVRAVAEAVGPRFGITTIGGWRASARDLTGHPAGLALDLMCTHAQGDPLAEFLIGNADALAIRYIIWRQRIRKPGQGWEAMSDRGSPTQNHEDHVHASFKPTPPVGGISAAGLGALKGIGGAAGDVVGGVAGDAASAMLAPFRNWAEDAQGLGVKVAAATVAGALIVVGMARLVVPPAATALQKVSS